ncbi:MAG: (2Fe-2S) ferredoxin domain-containing protein [Kovacikia sp.]
MPLTPQRRSPNQHQNQGKPPDSMSCLPRQVLVCQNITCRKQGSAQVLAAFRSAVSPAITVFGCGCLGECGNGPIVLVLPEQTWYSHVNPEDVPLIVTHHLQAGHPVTAKLYQKFHPPR